MTQDEILRAINDAIDNNGEFPDFGNSETYTDEEDNENINSLFGDLVEERMKKNSNPVPESVDEDNVKETIVPVEEKEVPNTSSSDEFNVISITKQNDDYQLLIINDGIKTNTIDLNALDPDPEGLLDMVFENGVNVQENLKDIANTIFDQIISTCYPTAILTNDQADNVFCGIADMDYEKFHVVDYYDESLKILYYVPEESMDAYNETVLECITNGHIVSFLITLVRTLNSDGITFANLTDQYTRTLMSSDKYMCGAMAYEMLLLEDMYTEKLEEGEFKDSIYDAINVQPYDYDITSIIEFLSYLKDSDENPDDESDESDGEDDEESEAPITNTVINNTVVVADTVKVEESQDVNETTSEPYEESDGTDIFNDEDAEINKQLDEEEKMEEAFFNGKKSSNGNSHHASMKNTKGQDNNSNEYVVKRHK